MRINEGEEDRTPMTPTVPTSAPRPYIPLSLRRDSYEAELRHLSTTYDVARRRDSSDLRDVLNKIIALPTWYVGNGGTMAVAHYAAALQNYRTGRPALATTSLGYITSHVTARSAVVVVSASARHPDTAAAVQAALERRVSEVVLITERGASELVGVLSHPSVKVISLDRPGPPDGFLATNSIMNMATSIAAAHLRGRSMPDELPSLRDDVKYEPQEQRDNVIILASTGFWGAAIDLETRLAETGLAAAQTTDYRNFAHGRHLGLSRNRERTRVVAFSDPTTKSLSKMTTAELPPEVPILTLSTPLDEPVSCLDLLGHSIRFLANVAAQANVDPARPSVPNFGRRLYHLRGSRLLDRASTIHPAVLRKLEASSLPLDEPHLSAVMTALARWLKHAASLPISAVILDYDGTVCTTAGRYDPPPDRVQAQVVRLLEMGVTMGFASGRGASLPEGLRSWIPMELMDRTLVAMYNGAVITRLDLEAPAATDGPFTSVATEVFLDRVFQRAEAIGAKVTVRPLQVSVQPAETDSACAPLALAMSEVVAAHNAGSDLRLKAVTSAHSVDVILATTSKNALREVIIASPVQSGSILAIGDQGALGGNDFELLAADPLSLSVDDVSSDPTRCWNLGSGAQRGPEVLVKYLQSIRRDRTRTLALRWPAV